MPGTIVDVKAKVGDTVEAGDGVLVIEAMKMENEIQAPQSGVVISVHVKKGDSVAPDETLVEIQCTE
jgi:pyruvate carboxylase subunit B